MSLLLDLLYPHTCYSCGHSGSYFCPACLSQLHTLPISYPKGESPLDGSIRLFRYRKTIRQLVEDVKYQFCYDLIPEIAHLMANYIQQDFPHILHYWQDNNFSLVPIPLHWSRQNWRGFNQSDLLCQSLSPLLHLSVAPALIRPHFTPSQVSQPDKQSRLTNITGAFHSNPDLGIANQNYLIVDDVITTGATITQAALALQSAHASSLWSLSLAG